MPFIIGANSAVGGFSVDNSCMFDDGSSPYLTESVSSTSNRRTFTFSTWVKRSSLSGSGYPRLFNPFVDSSNFFDIFFRDTDALNVYSENGASNDMNLVTNRLFRDCSAWYHIVVAVDTTQGVAANRVKIYVNGTQETSFSTETYPALDTDFQINLDTVDNVIGRNEAGDNNYLDGYLSEVVFIDGLQLAPTSFGEFDEDSPTIWKPINVSGLTFGTNGFYLDFEDSSALGNDVSGNGNDFTVNNLTATDQATDTPVNNFNILNAIHPTAANFTISEGATKITITAASNVGGYLGTLMPTTGKWYFEVKIDEAGAGDRTRVGIANYESITGTTTMQTMSAPASGLEVSCKTANILRRINGSSTDTTASGDYADGDIVNFAMDLDNNAIYVGRNGTWLTLTGTSGGDPTSGASKTGAIVTDTTYILNGGPMCTYFGHYAGGSDTSTVSYNFGNPAFTISSGNADADGYGNFEYAVPSGYFALCTKNLGAYGG